MKMKISFLKYIYFFIISIVVSALVSADEVNLSLISQLENQKYDVWHEAALKLSKSGKLVIPILVDSLVKENNPSVLDHIAYTLSLIGEPAIPVLLDNLDIDKRVRDRYYEELKPKYPAAYALGLIGEPSIPLLQNALASKVGYAAVYALGEIGEPSAIAVPMILSKYKREYLIKDWFKGLVFRSFIVDNLAEELAKIGEPSKLIVNELKAKLKDIESAGDYDKEVSVIVEALVEMGEPAKSAKRVLKKKASYYDNSGGKTEKRNRRDVATALKAIDNPDVNSVIIELRNENDPVIRRHAARYLGRLGKTAESAIPLLVKATTDWHPAVRRDAARALGKISKEADTVIPELIGMLDDSNYSVRCAAVEALGRFGQKSKAATPALVKELDNRPDWLRNTVILALRRIGEPHDIIIPILEKASKDENGLVRKNAIEVLGSKNTRESLNTFGILGSLLLFAIVLTGVAWSIRLRFIKAIFFAKVRKANNDLMLRNIAIKIDQKIKRYNRKADKKYEFDNRDRIRRNQDFWEPILVNIMSKINDPHIIVDIARKADSDYIRKSAFNKLISMLDLMDINAIVELANRNSDDNFIYAKLMEWVGKKDKSKMVELFLAIENPENRKQVISIINNKDLLVEFAKSETNRDVFRSIAEKISDEAILSQIPKTAKYPNIHKIAIESDLLEMVADDMASISASGISITELFVSVKNLIGIPFYTKIMVGTVFITSGSCQNMVVTKTEYFKLEKEFSARLPVACANANRDIPSPKDGFSHMQYASSDLVEILQEMEKLNSNPRVKQAAVWAITDNLSGEQIRQKYQIPQKVEITDSDGNTTIVLYDDEGKPFIFDNPFEKKIRQEKPRSVTSKSGSLLDMKLDRYNPYNFLYDNEKKEHKKTYKKEYYVSMSESDILSAAQILDRLHIPNRLRLLDNKEADDEDT